MRYKVRAPNDSAYRDLLSLLEGKVELFVTSPRRLLIGTGELPESIRTLISSRGGEISEDHQYHVESSTRTDVA